MKPGYYNYRDGNMWGAVGPAHRDLVQSPAGFGPTKEEAVKALVADPRFQKWLREAKGIAPELTDFREETPWSEPGDAG